MHTYEERVLTRDHKNCLRDAIKRFMARDDISEHNKKLLLRYMYDAALGKTNAYVRFGHRAVSPATITNKLVHLHVVSLFLCKNLDEVEQEDIEALIIALETDKIRSRAKPRWGNATKAAGRPLSAGYKQDIKITVRNFYKWLWGNNEFFPDIVRWIDTKVERRHVPAIPEEGIARMIAGATSLKQRALIQVFFDGGLRLGELLNVRLHNVFLRSFDPHDRSKKCFFVHIPYSKTGPRTISLPMQTTQDLLRLWLEQHPRRPQILQSGSLDCDNMSTQLFPLEVSGVHSMLKRAGRTMLGRNVTPQLMRHSSATYWANRLPHYSLSKRFGWSLTSRTALEYIDKAGIHEHEVAQNWERHHHTRESERKLAESKSWETLARYEEQLNTEGAGRERVSDARAA